LLDLKSVQRLGGRKGMAASGLDLPCTGSSRTHLWLFAPGSPPYLSLSLARLREGGHAEFIRGGSGTTGSPGREYASGSGAPPQELFFFFLVCVIFLGWEYFEERRGRGRYGDYT